MILKDKIIIVTGGAQGIGKAIVDVLVQKGAYVVIADIDKTAGNQTAEEIPNCEFYQIDLCNDSEIEKMFEYVNDKFGHIDSLVNDAGIQIRNWATDFDMDQFLSDVDALYQKNGKVFVAVSEGIHYADGSFVSEAKTSATDGFGHAQLGGLAAMLAEIVKNRTGAKVRGIELSLLQRCGAHLASATDIDEAFTAGKVAVEKAIEGNSGYMVAFERETVDGQYHCAYRLLPLDAVANFEKKVPLSWINDQKNGVKDEFISYVLPLIQGEANVPKEDSLPRYARLKKVLANQR